MHFSSKVVVGHAKVLTVEMRNCRCCFTERDTKCWSGFRQHLWRTWIVDDVSGQDPSPDSGPAELLQHVVRFLICLYLLK